MDAVERDLGLIAELALGARSLAEFERTWIESLRPTLGFETACSVWTDQRGLTRSATALGYPEATLREQFSSYMSELTPAEVAGFSGGSPAIDTETVSRSRREALTVYRELLVPSRVTCFVTNVWPSRWGVFGFHLARCGRGTAFGSREVELLTRLIGAVKLGQALHASEELRATPEADWWASAWELSRRESEVALLVARGLSNPEIAALLRTSRHTIRNHLVSVFRKAAVSTRAELVFAMNTPRALAAERPGDARPWSSAWNGVLARSERSPL